MHADATCCGASTVFNVLWNAAKDRTGDPATVAAVLVSACMYFSHREVSKLTIQRFLSDSESQTTPPRSYSEHCLNYTTNKCAFDVSSARLLGRGSCPGHQPGSLALVWARMLRSCIAGKHMQAARGGRLRCALFRLHGSLFWRQAEPWPIIFSGGTVKHVVPLRETSPVRFVMVRRTVARPKSSTIAGTLSHQNLQAPSNPRQELEHAD